jgi:hypothetical protein
MSRRVGNLLVRPLMQNDNHDVMYQSAGLPSLASGEGSLLRDARQSNPGCSGWHIIVILSIFYMKRRAVVGLGFAAVVEAREHRPPIRVSESEVRF